MYVDKQVRARVVYRRNNKSLNGWILKSLPFILKIIAITEVFRIVWEMNTTFQRCQFKVNAISVALFSVSAFLTAWVLRDKQISSDLLTECSSIWSCGSEFAKQFNFVFTVFLAIFLIFHWNLLLVQKALIHSYYGNKLRQYSCDTFALIVFKI